jgi:hypothetical protein
MVKVDLCFVAFEIRCALEERRLGDAERMAIEHLEAGYHSPEFLKVVAEILKSKKEKGKKGQPRKQYKEHWIEIGEAFCELADDDIKYEEAIDLLVGKKWFGKTYSRGTIAKAVACYRAARTPK